MRPRQSVSVMLYALAPHRETDYCLLTKQPIAGKGLLEARHDCI